MNFLKMVAICLCAGLLGAYPPARAADQGHQDGSESSLGAVHQSQAEFWVKQRTLPSFILEGQEEKKKKTPVRTLFKSVAKGAKSELGTSFDDMGKDMVLVFSVQDIDPYAKKGPPKNKPAIVMKMTMVDGSSAYLHRFPDNSFAVEDGFADGTVMEQDQNGGFIVKYPNGVQGRVVFQGSQILVYRPDKTITTFKKTASGAYSVSNDKFGYMGTARADDSGDKFDVNN
jgi:hypothetical protein